MGCNKGDIKPFVKGGKWRCTACTYAHNSDTKLKCEMGACTGNTRPADSLFYKCCYCGFKSNPIVDDDDKCSMCSKGRVPIDTNLECPICYCEIGTETKGENAPIKLRCGHVFHGPVCLLDLILPTLKKSLGLDPLLPRRRL